ncbi:non-heme iron oxygenase ferredoxin subunit [Chromatium okenii]|jgi:3-phenylpropionate/trans-cinnamate dioxygenase ferredoxin subunit|uniref:(2Fe-2S)-binding protein n=1 Tax=Chromatium okenii TaxID=61644 RepID=A0A2S7XTU4_9GAMM|nr:non-heme iron oxygenase ferredoxin subunit [Chromatium okenii]PQJ97076.1 (2Fe-2S)-binding protein [Chromatium okenii]
MDAPWIAVSTPEAIAPGKFIKVTLAQRAYLIANVNGQFYAVEDNCSHEDYPLSFGCLDGAQIKCSLHGSRFSLETGAPLDAPAEMPICIYPVRIAEGQVWLDPTAMMQ